MAIGFTNAQKKIGTDVSDTTAVASDVLASEDFYLANGTKATGTIPTYSGSTEITENATLETEGKYLASDIVVNVSGEASGYVRPTGAPDIDTIAANAPDIVDNGTTYRPLYVLALMDTIASKTFSKTGTGVSTGGDAFVFSDEPSTLYVGNTTHTFDTAADISTSENWKARYVIVYGIQAIGDILGITVNLYLYRATYEMVGCSGTIFSYASTLFGTSTSSSGNKNIRYINIQNSSFSNDRISSSSYFCAYCVSLTTLNLPNSLTFINVSYFCSGCSSLTTLSSPNLTTLQGSDFCYNCRSLTILSLPDLTTLQGSYFCSSCSSLTTLSLPSLTTISNGGYFCYNCYNLKNIDLHSLTSSPLSFDTINIMNYTTFITLPIDFDFDAINFTGATGYTKSIAWFHHLATQLKDNSGGTAKTMVLGATNIALIPSADAATISAKNWTLT